MLTRLPSGWTREELLAWAAGAPLQVLLTILGAILLRAIVLRAIAGFVETSLARGDEARARRPAGRDGEDGATRRQLGLAHERHRQRTRTMGALLRSITTVVITGVAVLTIMAILGVPLAPLLASAGVGGVALGFGAQSLVKDFLSGIFLILEDQYGVGDLVDTGEAVGTVEDVTLRITRLRDPQGVIWYVRNGEILRVANRSQGWATATVDIPFSYREDVDRVIGIITAAVGGLGQDESWRERLIDEPQVLGVQAITGGAVTVRVLARCTPEENWAVERELRRRVKEAFDRAGVAGPPLVPATGPSGATPGGSHAI